MDELQARTLLKRYLAGNATAVETRLIEDWWEHLQNQSDWLWQEGEKEAFQAMMESRLLNQIREVQTAIHFISPFKKYRRWIAAAAMLVGISLGTYFLNQNRKTVVSTIAALPSTPDISPGTNKAILMLGNGSKITLDSSAIGILAQQGNTKIVAVDNGKLAYNISSENPTAIVYNTLTTPRGGQHQLVLSDGTKVWLDAASSITYPIAFIGKERKVSISGQAYFEVVHNQKMPFRVEVNNQVVEDLGTAFNINAYSDEGIIKTTLLEGSVKIVLGQQMDKSGVMLKPGEQAQANSQITGNGGKIKIIEDVNIDQVVAWKNGFFKFDQSDIQSVMKQISRWYDVEVSYPEGVPNDKYWGGIPRNVKLSNVFRILEESGAHFRIEGSKVIVLPDHK